MILEKNIIYKIEKILDYEFNNKGLLEQAFTREAFARERQILGEEVYGNEQLEFFGDSILNYILIKNLEEKFCILKNEKIISLNDEGRMSDFISHFTNKKMLSRCIEKYKLQDFLILNKGDQIQNVQNSQSVKEDLFEAIIGAIWIDSNKEIDIVEKVVMKLLNLDNYVLKNYFNAKTKLKNWAEKRNIPLFFDSEELDGEYNVVCFLEYYKYETRASAKKIKDAENMAANDMLKLLGEDDDRDLNIVYDLDNSINKLQELSQKKIIGQIKYQEIFDYENNVWNTSCTISNFKHKFVGTDQIKMISKKKAAFNVLETITKGMGIQRLNMYKKDIVFMVYETSKDNFDIKVGTINKRSKEGIICETLDNSIMISLDESCLNVTGVFKSIYDAITNYFMKKYDCYGYEWFNLNKTMEYIIFKEEINLKEHIDEVEHLNFLKNIVDELEWDEYMSYLGIKHYKFNIIEQIYYQANKMIDNHVKYNSDEFKNFVNQIKVYIENECHPLIKDKYLKRLNNICTDESNSFMEVGGITYEDYLNYGNYKRIMAIKNMLKQMKESMEMC